jgi:uncharacterized membrane protein YadS
VPLFVVGFLAAVVLRTLVDLPEAVVAGADTAQTVLLGLALVGLGSSVRLERLARTGGRAVLVGLGSWVFVAGLSLLVVLVLPLA